MAQGERIPECVRLVVLPGPGVRVPPALGFGVVHAYLAHVMQQGQDRHGFLLGVVHVVGSRLVRVALVPDRQFPQTPVNIQTMDHQAASVGTVVLGPCRGREKVRAFQPGQQLVRAGSADKFVNTQKISLGISCSVHAHTSTP